MQAHTADKQRMSLVSNKDIEKMRKQFQNALWEQTSGNKDLEEAQQNSRHPMRRS